MTFQRQTSLEKSSESSSHKTIQSSKTHEKNDENDDSNKKKLVEQRNEKWADIFPSEEDEFNLIFVPETTPKQPQNKQIPTPKQLLRKSDEVSSENNNKTNPKQPIKKLELPKGNCAEQSTEDSNTDVPKTIPKLQLLKKSWVELSTEDSDRTKFVPRTTPKQQENKQIPTPTQPEHSCKTNKNQLNNKKRNNNNQSSYTELPEHSYRATTNHSIFYNDQTPTLSSFQQIQPPIQAIQEPSASSYQRKQNGTNQPTQQPCQQKEQIYNIRTSLVELKTLFAALLFETEADDIKKKQTKY